MNNLLNLEPQKVSKDVRNYSSFIYGIPKVGKAQDVDMMIPTPNGDMRFGDLKVGDEVYNRKGEAVKVSGIYPQGVKEAYEVTFSDGRKTICCNEHLWSYITSRNNLKTTTLKEIEKDYKKVRDTFGRDAVHHKYSIPTNNAVVKSEKEYMINPYVIGALIGDGCLRENGIAMSSSEVDIVSKVAELLGVNFHKSHKLNYTWRFEIGYCNIFTPELVRLGLKDCRSEDKFIPQEYLEGSIEQRKELLKGLMDTDGNVNTAKGTSKYNFTTTAPQLQQDFLKLCRSLGYTVTTTIDNRASYKSGVCYNNRILTDEVIVSSEKHLNRLQERQGGNCKNKGYIKIVDIKSVAPREMMCIMVDDEEHLYLCNDYIVTHNTTFVHELYGKDVLFIATENRYKALNGAYVQKVNSWSEFKATLNQLANPKVKERWQVVCVDTVDNLAKMCDKFIAQKYEEEHCGDKLIPYGKDWVDLRQEWDDNITMIDKLGYTPCFVSHAMVKTVKIPVESMLETDITGDVKKVTEKDKNGNKVEFYEFEKYTPNLRDKMFAPLNNMCDNILFLTESVDTNGVSKRVIHLRETINHVAGCTFKNVKPVIELSAEAFKSAIEKAIGSYDEEDLTEEKTPKFYEEKTPFADVVKKAGELGKQVGQKFGREKLVKVIESVLGEGKKLSECTEEQQELVEVAILEFEKMLAE